MTDTIWHPIVSAPNTNDPAVPEGYPLVAGKRGEGGVEEGPAFERVLNDEELAGRGMAVHDPDLAPGWYASTGGETVPWRDFVAEWDVYRLG